MTKKIFEILHLCNEINKIDGFDAFFDYAGHVEQIRVYVQTKRKDLPRSEHGHIYNYRIYIVEDTYLTQEQLSKNINKMHRELEQLLLRLLKINNIKPFAEGRS